MKWWWIAVVVVVMGVAWINRWTFTYKFDPVYWENFYYHSQWNIPIGAREISDGGVYRYVGYRLVNGENPFNIDYWVPPLGKYVYGLGAKYLNNPFLISFGWYLLGLGLVGLIADQWFKKDKNLMGLAIIGVASSPLIVAQIGLTMLDIPQMVFLLLHIYLLFRAKERKNWLWLGLAGVALGGMAGVKLGYFSAMIMLVDLIYVFRVFGVRGWILLVGGMGIGYMGAYFCYFINHPNPIPWLRLHDKVWGFWAGSKPNWQWLNGLKYIFFNEYTSGEIGGNRTPLGWSIWLPVGLIGSMLTLIKNFKNSYLGLIILGWIAMCIPIGFWPRYLVPMVPLMILLTVKMLDKKRWLIGLLIVGNIISLRSQIWPSPEILAIDLAKWVETNNYAESYQELSSNSKNSIGYEQWTGDWHLNRNKWKVYEVKTEVKNITWKGEVGKFDLNLDYVTRWGKIVEKRQIDLVKENNRWTIKWDEEYLKINGLEVPGAENNNQAYVWVVTGEIQDFGELFTVLQVVTGLSGDVIREKINGVIPDKSLLFIGTIKKDASWDDLEKLAGINSVRIENGELLGSRLIEIARPLWPLLTPETIGINNFKDCRDRYATIVNPVRSRELWKDKSLKPIDEQYSLIKKNDLAATWLVQYDVLADRELLDYLRKFDNKQEVGLFLEISNKLATDSRVIYQSGTYWYNPKVVFLSGYSQSERIKLIDRLMGKFKDEFGYYPSSVGAWWIDSFSLNYLKEKYEIKAVLIVADQKTTDDYGVWGQWWGVPYYPSKYNILVPASEKNKLDLVVVQWAQRDLSLAYGDGPKFSNYSLQANDYIRQGKDTNYFMKLASNYFDCQNPIGQITVGLESGMESVDYIEEYGQQMEALGKWGGLETVTMGDFYDKYVSVYPDLAKNVKLEDGNTSWQMTLMGRQNQQLGDGIVYQSKVAFGDYFVADKADFLDRNLVKLGQVKNGGYFGWWMIVAGGMGLALGIKKKWNLLLWGGLFGWMASGLLWRSYTELGWQVFFGISTKNLWLAQILSLGLVGLLVLSFEKVVKNKWLGWVLPATFAIDTMVNYLRFSVIEGSYYVGILLDTFRLIGLSVSKNLNIGIVNTEMVGYQAGALLKFDWQTLWSNGFWALTIYMLGHWLLAIILANGAKKLPKIFRIIVVLMFLLALIWAIDIARIDPRVVIPNL